MTHPNPQPTDSLKLIINKKEDTLCFATVVVPAATVGAIYGYIVQSLQKNTQAAGFNIGTVPLPYIEQNFSASIMQYLKEFLFNFLVINFLYKEVRNQKLLIAGEPRLHAIDVEPHQDAQFSFEINVFPSLEIYEWKHLPFKAPKRKKYKDLDRQVDAFIKEEAQAPKENPSAISVGDWVNFDVLLMHDDQKPLLTEQQTNFWMKIGDEEADKPLRDIFEGKKVGDTFCIAHRSLQHYFSDHLDIDQHFSITISDILPNNYFCIEQFKKYFKLKTNKEIYQKLIEVFSYRNDLSQRRSMAEESLKLLLSKHKFEIPNHIILRQQKKVLDAVQSNPDYHVYRMQKDFKKRIRQLAEKQTKELLLLDQIAYAENITVTHQDTKQYLNLMRRPRTKEFIYFDPPTTRVGGQEIPYCGEELKQACLREKTLNYIIYHLTKA